MRKLLLTLLALLLVASACSASTELGVDPTPPAPGNTGGDQDPGTGTGGDNETGGDDAPVVSPIRFLAGLTPFGECDAALDHLRREAAEHVGPWGFQNGGGGFGPEIMEGGMMDGDMAEEAAMEADAPASFDASSDQSGSFTDVSAPIAPRADGESGSGDNTFTDTNVQELGVSEPDIIKTDGNRILVMAQGNLYYVDVSGDTPQIVSKLNLNIGWAQEMFITNDRAYVFSRSDYWQDDVAIQNFVPVTSDVAPAATPPPPDQTEPAPEPVEPPVDVDAEDRFVEDPIPVERPGEPIPVEPPGEPFPGEPLPPEGQWAGPASVVQEVDISNPGAMSVLATLTIEGDYLSARAVGDTGRMVLTSYPNDLQFVFPSGPGSEERSQELNREAVLNSTLEDWIPTYTLETAAGTDSGMLIDCNRLHAPSEFAGFNIISVLTLNLSDGLTPGDAVGIIADGQTVYASTDNLYVGTSVWVSEQMLDNGDGRNWREEYSTAIHQFSTPAGSAANYVASGSVRGHMLNQFAMNEHNGDLQVVTTDGAPWDEGTESFLTVLRPTGEELNQVGQVGDLGKGERVFSARLLGDVGYVVTFRQVDPFYVLDTSDPANPFIAGELKLPGNSTYLHSVSPTRVLGIGQDATDDGRTIGLKAELFDVSDPANPTAIAKWVEPNAGSAAEYDHRAFQIIPERNLAILPVNTWSGQFSGAVLLNLEDLTEYGRITQDLPEGPATASDCRQITQEMVPENSDLFWMTAEGTIVQVCNDADTGGWNGQAECEQWLPEDLQWLVDDYDGDDPVVPQAITDLGDFDRLEVCWLDYGSQFQIERTLAINDTLWSMSWQVLQANNLDDLADTTSRITLN